MKVREIMQPNVRRCQPTDSARTAALIMEEADCGALPVTDDTGKLLGIVTDRDLLLVAAGGEQPLAEILVDEAMSPGSYVCRADDDIQVVERLMCRYQVRRVPVVDPDAHLIGIVSLSDLARNQSAQPTGDPTPDRQVVAAMLEAIVQPSQPQSPMDSAAGDALSSRPQ